MTQRKKFIGICCFLGITVLLIFAALYQKKMKKNAGAAFCHCF